jgi:4-hydroxybenzoate polyprenyltransferase
VLRFLADMLLIRRLEFRVAEVPILAIPVLFLARDGSPLRSFAFWEGVFLFFLLFAFGDMINCLADRDLDAIYKQRLSRAVYGLGVKFVTFQVVASAVVAVAVASHLSWALGRWGLLGLVLVGLALGAAYSVEPVRLKGRGLAQLLCLWLVIFVGPMVLAGLLVSPHVEVGLLALAAAFGSLQMGVILVNTAEDYPEDLEAGVNTTIVSLGLARGIGLAYGLTLGGAVALLATLGALFWYEGLGAGTCASLLPVAGACAYAVRGVGNVARAVTAAPEEAVRAVKREAKKVPLWLTAIAWSTLVAATAFFLARPGKN